MISESAHGVTAATRSIIATVHSLVSVRPRSWRQAMTNIVEPRFQKGPLPRAPTLAADSDQRNSNERRHRQRLAKPRYRGLPWHAAEHNEGPLSKIYHAAAP
jgi:hypothetical protein